ncbi:MAG: hypothetical protein ABW088_10965 [Sedimenticola sp.]
MYRVYGQEIAPALPPSLAVVCRGRTTAGMQEVERSRMPEPRSGARKGQPYAVEHMDVRERRAMVGTKPYQ